MSGVIVAINSMSRFYIESLVHEVSVDLSSVEVITFFKGELYDPATVGRLQSSGAVVKQVRYGTQISQLLELRKLIKYLRIQVGNGATDFYIPHPSHLLTNFVASEIKRRSPHVRVHLIPDGADSYYLRSVAPMRAHMRKLVVIGLFLGFRYQILRDNTLGLGEVDYFKYWSVGHPGIVPNYLPVRVLRVPPPRVSGTSIRQGDALLLGQFPTGKCFNGAYIKFLKQVASRHDGRVDYRPHPREVIDRSVLEGIFGDRLEIVSSKTPAEIQAMSYSSVIAPLSSTLLNLAALGWRSEGLYCEYDVQSLVSILNLSDKDARELLRVASELGIEAVHAI